MARYEHLPIYRLAFAVALHLEQVVAGFSRYHKYTLGTELRQASRAVVLAIAAAEPNATPPLRSPSRRTRNSICSNPVFRSFWLGTHERAQA